MRILQPNGIDWILLHYRSSGSFAVVFPAKEPIPERSHRLKFQRLLGKVLTGHGRCGDKLPVHKDSSCGLVRGQFQVNQTGPFQLREILRLQHLLVNVARSFLSEAHHTSIIQ